MTPGHKLNEICASVVDSGVSKRTVHMHEEIETRLERRQWQKQQYAHTRGRCTRGRCVLRDAAVASVPLVAKTCEVGCFPLKPHWDHARRLSDGGTLQLKAGRESVELVSSDVCSVLRKRILAAKQTSGVTVNATE